jgi:hydrogenase-4 component B
LSPWDPWAHAPDADTLLAGALLALALMALAGPAAWLGRARSEQAQRLSCALSVGGSLLGLLCCVCALLRPDQSLIERAWWLPLGSLRLGADALSWAFLIPVFTVPGLSAVYALGYWSRARHANARSLTLWLGALAAAMGLVLLARDGVLFLLAWEVMALAGYFASGVERKDPAVRASGWVYLASAHLGGLCLAALFALACSQSGRFSLDAQNFAALPRAAANAVFVLGLAGFGMKAGLVPLHFWLPGTHAGAPSHASAVLSGVMLNIGVYGLARLGGLLPNPELWWGSTLLGLGALSAVVGALLALAQGDLKRILAYSSVENMGIAAMGLGLALLGRAAGRPDWTVLGLAGMVLQVWNHSLFKPLLFYGAGALAHESGTRRISRLGGLAARMPATALALAVGSAAICGLPPFNGFVGEWLIYLGGASTLDAPGSTLLPLAALSAAALAVAGALALACFVRLYGITLLGRARGPESGRAKDPGASMLAPMAILACACVALGAAAILAGPLARVALSWQPGLDAGALDQLHHALAWTPALAAGLWLAGGAAWLLSRALLRGKRSEQTWACAFPDSSARVQYTGQSLARSLSGALDAEAREPVLDRLLAPLLLLFRRGVKRLRALQQGSMQVYLAYFMAALAFLLLLH